MDDATFELQFGPSQLERLAALATTSAPVQVHDLRARAVRQRLSEVEVLVTSWGCPPLDEELLAAAPRLRAVLHAAGSVRGHVSGDVFDRGILVTTAADVNAVPVAHYTLAAVLWALKKVPFLSQDARLHREDWSYRERRGDLSGEGRTVVLVGFSRIGRRVAELLAPLQVCRVLVVDPFASADEVAAAGAELVGLDDALGQADVVSLHAPSLPETRHMIGEAELLRLAPGATIINTARGALIDGAALEKACVDGRLGAILDVTDPEPLPAESPLYDLPNVVITPHVAGSMGSETRRMADTALTELERYGAGLPPLCPITLESWKVQA